MKRKYIWNYPRAALGRMGFNIFLGALFVVPFLLASGLGTQAYISLLRWEGFHLKYVIYLIFLIPIFLLFSALTISPLLGFLIHSRRKRLPVSLRAYLRIWSLATPDPRDSRNWYGSELARQCRKLDKIADDAGVVPLYELGIREEGKAETQWFPAERCLKTLDVLLQNLDSQNDLLDERDALLRDLKMLRAVLEKGGSFHLMLV